jgi:hypothetical protein
MEVEKALGELERLISNSRLRSRNEEFWPNLFDAEMKGVANARADMAQAATLGVDPVLFLKQGLERPDRQPNWSATVDEFEVSIAERAGYKECLDVLVTSRTEQRMNPKSMARVARQRADQDLDI